MKNIAKLTLFFTLSFIILFIFFVSLRLLSVWVNLIRNVPVAAELGEDAAQAAWAAFPMAIYFSVLLSLSYTIRKKISVSKSIICVWILGIIFTIGVPIGINRVGTLKPAILSRSSLQGRPGLILSRSENIMILLHESHVFRGPRVVSIPGQPLIYQAIPLGPNNTILGLPALPFNEDVPWFMQSLIIDFTLCARELENRLNTGFPVFIAYAVSLILLLGSLHFILGLSRWPLANLFLGALVFRMILAFDIFLNTGQINNLIFSFLKERVPSAMITPLVFCAVSVLVIFYTIITNIARPGRNDG